MQSQTGQIFHSIINFYTNILYQFCAIIMYFTGLCHITLFHKKCQNCHFERDVSLGLKKSSFLKITDTA